MNLSVVIPVFNEAQSITSLIGEITGALTKIDYEIVVVDDCSSGETVNNLTNIQSSNERLRIIRHERNYGQSFAIRSGVKFAKSKWIATLDGDGQNDPSDIPRLFDALIEKSGTNKNILIAGYRFKRKDSWLKRISSRYANKVRSNLLKDEVPDTGCGLKLFSRDYFLDLPSFNHMHRYIPALYISRGGVVYSLEVNHRHREKGQSKYGFNNRFWVGITDLIGVKWLQRRSKKITYKEV